MAVTEAAALAAKVNHSNMKRNISKTSTWRAGQHGFRGQLEMSMTTPGAWVAKTGSKNRGEENGNGLGIQREDAMGGGTGSCETGL